MTSANFRNLTLIDPETNISYNFVLNSDDLNRALQDDHFANKLLQQAKENCSENQHEAVKENEENNSSIETTTIPGQENCKTSYVWQYNQVLALINSMGNHLSELNDPLQRKDMYEHVANDLLSLKYEVNASMVHNKWKSLVKSYRNARDTKKRTGRGPSRFLFYDAMDSLLGGDPTNDCSHSIESSSDANPVIIVEQTPSNSVTGSTPTNSSKEVNITEKDEEKVNLKIRPRISGKNIKNDYVLLKKEEYAKRDQRHKERMALEARKLDLLEQYINTKK